MSDDPDTPDERTEELPASEPDEAAGLDAGQEEGPGLEEGIVFDVTGLPALERLRERITLAAREIHRLREENQQLAARLAASGPHREEGAGRTLLELGEDPDALREKINGFIETLDRYLAEQRPAE